MGRFAGLNARVSIPVARKLVCPHEQESERDETVILGFGVLNRIIGGSDVSPSHDLGEPIVTAAEGDTPKASEFVGIVAVVDERRERPRAFSTP